jgi:CRISPR type I-D-associated protein Csc3/Cas10d
VSENNIYSSVLRDYFDHEDSIADRMLNRGYLTKPAKSAGFVGKHDKDYHIDQSLYIHIVNGVFAITRLLEYIARTSPFQLGEEDFRTVLSIFTLHDIHKDPEASRGSKKEFDVNLDAFRTEGEALGLFDFANVSVEQMRLGMMHLNKRMVGDLSTAPPRTARLISIVRLADTFASLHEASEYEGLARNLGELSPHLVGRYRFYHHELHEYRGLSTQLLHSCLTEFLKQRYQCYPLLFFANGVMYIGPSNETPSTFSEDIIADISKDFFVRIQREMRAFGRTVAGNALNPQQTVKFQQYVYMFSDVPDLLSTLESYAAKKAPKQFISDLVMRRSDKRPSFAAKYPSRDRSIETLPSRWRLTRP